MDLLTAAVRDFFVSKLGSEIAKQGIGLNFDPLPISVSRSEFERAGAFDEQRANEFFSRQIADHSAVCLDGQHYSQSGLSKALLGSVYEAAVLYPRNDLSETLIQRNQNLFDKYIGEVRKVYGTSQLASLDGNGTYITSRATPASWMNPSNNGWSSYQQRIVDSDNASPAPGVIGRKDLKLPWRTIDPDELRKLLRAVPPKEFIPPRIPDNLFWSLRPKKPDPTHPFIPPGLRDPRQPQFHRIGPGVNFGAVRAMPTALEVIGDNATAPAPAPMPQFRLSPELNARLEALKDFRKLTLDDIGFPPGQQMNQDDLDATSMLKKSLVEALESPVEGNPQDAIEVSFDYQFVSIDRDWIVWPFINDTNWYIPSMRRGQLTLGEEGKKPGVISSIPTKAVIIRNLIIKAKFTDEDKNAINDSFALGPFRLGRDIDLQEGSLRVNSMQIIAYLDVTLPELPPRSDPVYII